MGFVGAAASSVPLDEGFFELGASVVVGLGDPPRSLMSPVSSVLSAVPSSAQPFAAAGTPTRTNTLKSLFMGGECPLDTLVSSVPKVNLFRCLGSAPPIRSGDCPSLRPRGARCDTLRPMRFAWGVGVWACALVGMSVLASCGCSKGAEIAISEKREHDAVSDGGSPAAPVRVDSGEVPASSAGSARVDAGGRRPDAVPDVVDRPMPADASVGPQTTADATAPAGDGSTDPSPEPLIPFSCDSCAEPSLCDVSRRVCDCPLGWTRDGDACVDVDECALERAGCSQLCNNHEAGYSCVCSEGLALSPNQRSCIAVCEPGADVCDALNGVCLETEAGGRCGCVAGSWLGADGLTCQPSLTAVQLALGNFYSCVLQSDGTIYCWGTAFWGVGTPPAGVFTQFAAWDHACAVRPDQALECWGQDDKGQATPPSGSFVRVAVGDGHSCAIRTDGQLSCWGSDSDGQATPPSGVFTQLALGWAHSCGLRTDGTIQCWGFERYGLTSAPEGKFSEVAAGGFTACGLGLDETVVCWGDTSRFGVPVPSGKFLHIAGGSDSYCGLRPDRTVTCWGDEEHRGPLDPLAGEFVEVAVGLHHACGIRPDGRVECWGEDTGGNAIPPSGLFSAVAAGDNHACGTRSDGQLACWGEDGSGQATAPSGAFSQVAIGSHATVTRVGYTPTAHTCGLRTDGTIECWGSDTWGQATAPSGSFLQVTTAANYSCALDQAGAVQCWGDVQGEVPPGDFVYVSAGSRHGCGITTEGTVECWGTVPAEGMAMPSGTFTQLASGWEYTCGLHTDGQIECWGVTAAWQTSAPSGQFVQVSATAFSGCGLRPDGEVECWGSQGEVWSPASPGPYVQISGPCGLRQDSTIACWGSMVR